MVVCIHTEDIEYKYDIIQWRLYFYCASIASRVHVFVCREEKLALASVHLEPYISSIRFCRARIVSLCQVCFLCTTTRYLSVRYLCFPTRPLRPMNFMIHVRRYVIAHINIPIGI